MDRHMDLLRFHSAALDDSGRSSNLQRSEENWDRRAAEVSQFGLAPDDFALNWLQGKMDFQGQRILDISFGAGRYLQAFLERGAEVSGVEISRQMIAYTRQRLDQAGLVYQPEELRHSAWENVDLSKPAWQNWQGAFDLVFLYFSPAISSVAMLEKVLQVSRQSVYVSLYAHREDSLLSELQDEFQLPRRSVGADSADDLQHIAQILYAWGFFPHIAYEERSKTSQHSVDYIFERYASWLFKQDSADEKLRQQLRQALQQRSVEGKVSSRSRDVVGHLYVDKRLSK